MAKALFQRYMTLSENFDTAVADLYRDDARIIAFRKDRFGGERRLQLSGSRVQIAGPKDHAACAAWRDDRSRFSEITYTAEGAMIRIRAQRYSLLKGYASPYSMLVGSDAQGQWRIHEEV